MNYLNKFFSIFLLFFLFTNLSFSNEPVAYIDIDFILKNSDIGKKTLEIMPLMSQLRLLN